jgi:hypothetical protein
MAQPNKADFDVRKVLKRKKVSRDCMALLIPEHGEFCIKRCKFSSATFVLCGAAGAPNLPGGRAGGGAPRGRGETHRPGSASCCVAALRLCACAAVRLAIYPTDMAV